MDCAPCAYGVQEGLMKMDGVKAATVSLNKGKAFITLNPANTLTLATIQKEIKDNGFSPRDADVEMRGILKKVNRKQIIQVQNENFWVDEPHSNQSAFATLKKTPFGTLVTITGHVKDLSIGQAPVWQLTVEKVTSQPLKTNLSFKEPKS